MMTIIFVDANVDIKVNTLIFLQMTFIPVRFMKNYASKVCYMLLTTPTWNWDI